MECRTGTLPDLLGASDETAPRRRCFLWVSAAKAGIHVIDVGQIDGNVSKVMSECAASPGLTVPQAFGRRSITLRRPASSVSGS
jgi:hypothetical protein